MICTRGRVGRWAALISTSVMMGLGACGKAPTPGDTTPARIPALGVGTATLSWVPPRRNVDGSVLRDLAEYYISYGTSPDGLNRVIKISDPYTTTYTVDRLSPGTYYFNIVAVTAAGVRSGPSSTVSKTIR